MVLRVDGRQEPSNDEYPSQIKNIVSIWQLCQGIGVVKYGIT